MELTPADVALIIEAFEASDWQHLRVSLGGSLLELSKSGLLDPAATAAAPRVGHTAAHEPAAPFPAPPQEPAPSALQAAGAESGAAISPADAGNSPAGLHEIVAPSVGVFWRAPSPTSLPFVSEGAAVTDTDTVCIVEVMKLMSHVPAGVNGTVRAVLAENGQMVERGQALFLVEYAP